jgi:hypothetical protein
MKEGNDGGENKRKRIKELTCRGACVLAETLLRGRRTAIREEMNFSRGVGWQKREQAKDTNVRRKVAFIELREEA